MQKDNTYLESPDGLEQREVAIFHDLTGFQSCVSGKRVVSIIIMRSHSVRGGRSWREMENLLLHAERNFLVMLVAMIPGLDMLGA